MKKGLLWSGGILAAWLLLLALLLSCLQWRVSDMDYFRKEYTKYHVTEAVHMEMEDLLTVTEHMMAYLWGKESDLQVYTVIDGKENVPFFNEKEIRHMVDVKNLFHGGRNLRRFCLIGATAIILLFLWQKKGRLLLSTLRAGIFTGLLVCIALLGLGLTNFTKYFIQFHLMFFDNKDWLLDFRTDRLINIVPEGFFSDTTYWICGSFFAVSLIAFLGIHFLLKKGILKESK